MTYSIIDSINFIDRFDSFLKKTKPTSVKIIDNFEKFYLVKQICEKNKIEFSYSKFSYSKYSLKNKLKIKFREKYYLKILQKKFKNRLTIFKNKSNKIPIFENKLVIFSANVYRRKYYDFENNSEITREYLLDPLIPKLKNIDSIPYRISFNKLKRVHIFYKKIKNILF